MIIAIFAWMHQKGFHVLKWVFAVVANGVLSPLPFYFLISPAFYFSSLLGLVVATIVNLVIAAVVMPVLKTVVNRVGVNA